MKRAFIAHSYDDKNTQEAVLRCIDDALMSYGAEGFSFVEKYPPYPLGQETTMMNDALDELSKSDLMIAEVSTKAIGVGIEVGYARAKGIPIVYLKTSKSEWSKTVRGCSSAVIEYSSLNDLSNKLLVALASILGKQ